MPCTYRPIPLYQCHFVKLMVSPNLSYLHILFHRYSLLYRVSISNKAVNIADNHLHAYLFCSPSEIGGGGDISQVPVLFTVVNNSTRPSPYVQCPLVG